MASFPGQLWQAGIRKVKPIWIFDEAGDDGVAVASAGP